MPGVMLWGWDGTNWVKVLVNAAGKLIIDPTEILEDTPTDGEMGKAPTSNWAHDHADLPDVHHARQHAIGAAADHTGVITDTQHGVRTLANAHAHSALSGVTENQHHARQHAIGAAADHTGVITDTQHGVRTLANAHAHSALSGIGANDHHVAFVAADHTAIGNAAPHHAEAHTLASHTTKAHAELTGIGADDHHNRQHVISAGADHTGRIALSQMTDGTLGQVLISKGAGADPVYDVPTALSDGWKTFIMVYGI